MLCCNKITLPPSQHRRTCSNIATLWETVCLFLALAISNWLLPRTQLHSRACRLPAITVEIHYNVTYPITTHGDCKSMNLIYQLQCTECNAFYIGETRCSPSDCMNGHQFTTMISNTNLPVAIHTQSHQIPFQECWSVSVIHKLPASTLDHICRQFETAYQLVIQSRHTPGQHPLTPNSALAPMALKGFNSVSSILLLRKATVIWPKVYIFVLFHLS